MTDVIHVTDTTVAVEDQTVEALAVGYIAQTVSQGGGTPASTVTDETAYGVAKAVGVSTAYAREDHTHGSPSLGATSTTAAAGNHNHTGVYDPAGAATSSVSTHTAATDPHADRAYTDAQVATRTPTSRLITAGSGLTGGGDLSADRTLSASFGGVPPVASGTGSAGAASSLSRSDHVHPVNALAPSDHGLIAWNFVPYAATSGALAPTSGTVYLMKIPIPAAQTITNVIVGINVAGSGLTAGQNLAGLYSSGKTLLSATADQTSTWGSTTGPIIMALSAAQSVAAGYVYVAFLSVGTTPPTLNRGIGNINNVGLASATAAYATGGTGQTSLPANVTTTAYTAASIWAAVS